MRDEITGAMIVTYEPTYFLTSRDQRRSEAGLEVDAQSLDSLFLTSRSQSLTDVIDIYLQQAQAYCDEKQWEKAVQACQEALQVTPNAAEVYKLLGNIKQKQGAATDAMGFYAKALALRPDFPEVYSNLGSLYAYKKQWQTATAYYQKAIERDASFAPAYFNLAKVWKALKHPEKELDCLSTALKLQPDLGTAEEHYRMGQTAEAQANVEEAIVFYRQAVAQDDSFVKAYQRLADLLEDQCDWEGAAACYRQVLKLNAAAKPSMDQPAGQSMGQPAIQSPGQSPGQSAALARVSPIPARLSAEDQGRIQKLLQASSQRKLLQPMANVAALFSSGHDAGDHSEQGVAVASDSSRSPAVLGQQYAQAQDWPRAIQCFKQAIAQEPQSAVFYRNLAQVLDRNQQPQRAAEAWYRAFVLEPSWPSAKQCFELGEMLTQYGNSAAAINCYRQALIVQPDFKQATQRLADLQQIQARSAQARSGGDRLALRSPELAGGLKAPKPAKTVSVRVQKRAALAPSLSSPLRNAPKPEAISATGSANQLKMDDNQVRALTAHQQGETLQGQGLWSEAIAAYKQAVALNPNFSWSHHNTGDCYKELGDWKDAATAYREAIEINPDFAWSHYSLGETQEKLLNWGAAIEAYTRAAELDPHSVQISLSLAEALKHGGNSDRQKSAEQYLQLAKREGLDEEVYRQAIAINPSDLGVYERLGWALLAQDRVDEAIFVCQMGLQVDPNAVGMLLQLAELLTTQEQWERAVECAKRALKVDENSAAAHFRLGDVLSKKGDLEGAHGAFWRCLELDTHNYWAHQCIGNVCLWQGRFDEAIASYQRVIEINPNLATAHKHMGDAYTALGKVDEASGAYARAIELDPQVS